MPFWKELLVLNGGMRNRITACDIELFNQTANGCITIWYSWSDLAKLNGFNAMRKSMYYLSLGTDGPKHICKGQSSGSTFNVLMICYLSSATRLLSISVISSNAPNPSDSPGVLMRLLRATAACASATVTHSSRTILHITRRLRCGFVVGLPRLGRLILCTLWSLQCLLCFSTV